MSPSLGAGAEGGEVAMAGRLDGKIPGAMKSLIVYDLMGMNSTQTRALSVFQTEYRRVSMQHVLYRQWKSQRR